MTQEEKELLVKDLCARLPYGVRVSLERLNKTGILYDISIDGDITIDCGIYRHLGNINDTKPYLYPLSSIEELGLLEEYENIVCALNNDADIDFIFVDYIDQLLDFYHRNHLDYNELILKRLAINATGLNIY